METFYHGKKKNRKDRIQLTDFVADGTQNAFVVIQNVELRAAITLPMLILPVANEAAAERQTKAGVVQIPMNTHRGIDEQSRVVIVHAAYV